MAKGSTRALIAIIIFLGFLSLLSVAIISSPSNVAFNVTSNNLTETIISGQIPPITDVCVMQGSDNPFIDAIQDLVNVIPGINCALGFMSYLYSYATISTAIGWLAIIITAVIIALIYIGIGIVRGGK